MGRIITTTITCDRCEKPMARDYENEWIWFDHRKRPFYKISHTTTDYTFFSSTHKEIY